MNAKEYTHTIPTWHAIFMVNEEWIAYGLFIERPERGKAESALNALFVALNNAGLIGTAAPWGEDAQKMFNQERVKPAWKSLSKNDKAAVPDSLVPAVAVAAEFGITRRTPSSLA
jgi:hypothetical protein